MQRDAFLIEGLLLILLAAASVVVPPPEKVATRAGVSTTAPRFDGTPTAPTPSRDSIRP